MSNSSIFTGIDRKTDSRLARDRGFPSEARAALANIGARL